MYVKNSHNHHLHMLQNFKQKFWISTILTIPVLFLSPAIQEFLNITLKFYGDQTTLFILSSIIFFYGGLPFLKGSLQEIKNRKPGMMTLVAMAITVAYLYSSAVIFIISGKTFFWELATLIDIMLLGHIIEMKATMGASINIEQLITLLPSNAHLILPDGSIKNVKIKNLKENDKVLIKPGEKIPADGKILQGQSEVNEAIVTGESKPKFKKSGNKVIGGSINIAGSLTIEIEKTGQQTYIAQVVKMVKTALQSKSKTQNLANKSAQYLTVTAILVGIFTIACWLILGQTFPFALERMVTVMVITCPHALGLAIPLVASITTTISAQNGLLIKNRTAFEKARNISTVLFDKTGTLTKGKFEVEKIITLANWSEEEILQKTASIEKQSEHSIAYGIVEQATKQKTKFLPVQNFQAIAGKGATAIIENEKLFVGNQLFLEEINPQFNQNFKEIKLSTGNKPSPLVHRSLGEGGSLRFTGKTAIFIATKDEIKGAILLADQIRKESKIACDKLKKMKIEVAMITGDNEQVAQDVATKLGIKTFFAQVLPDKKSEKVKLLQQKGQVVAMVGDGINDAPALAQANVGIAIGSGTQITAQAADIILVKNDPANVVDLINLAKVTYRKMIQNLIWAAGYNIFAIPLAAGILYKWEILLKPAVGAIAMSLSTVIVAINSKFIKFKK